MKMNLAVAAALALLLAGCAAPARTASPGVASLGTGLLTSQALLGAAPSAISARLGAPDFRRSEPGAEIWQYGGRDCSLFIYFYGVSENAPNARYVDARKPEGGAADREACLASITPKRETPIS